MRKAYIQFGNKNELPMETIGCDLIENVTSRMAANVLYSHTGYGSKIPTSYMVRFNNRLYRIYSICYSNVSTEYILINKKKHIVNIDYA